MSRIIRAKAPLRLSFAGGGTDIESYYSVYGGAVLSTTIDKFAYCSLIPTTGTQYKIINWDDGYESRGDLGDGIKYDGTGDLSKAVANAFEDKAGFTLSMHSDAPWGSGLGSSSTHVVSLLGAFLRRAGKTMSAYEVAELAIDIERVRMGLVGGKQDQYSASFGGVNFIEFGSEKSVVNPLRVNSETLNELHYRLLLCSLGRTRLSSKIIEDQSRRFLANEPDTVNALHRTKELAFEMRDALLLGDVDIIGKLLDEAWEAKRKFSSLVSSTEIDDLYSDAKKNGAIGGKVLGAGGGGYMLFLSTSEGRMSLARRLNELGFNNTSFAFQDTGLTVWEG